MTDSHNNTGPLTQQQLVDALIRIGLVTLLIVACFRVFSPFLNLMLWALILAVTLYPLHQGLAARLGGKQGRAATLMVLAFILLLGVPLVMLASSTAQNMSAAHEAYQAGTLAIPAPPEKVAGWPLVGEQVFAAWTSASDNFPAFVEANRSAIESAVAQGLAIAKATAGTVMLFIGALIVSGVMMAWGANGSAALLAIFSRVAGPEQGPVVQNLSTMTTRSVAVGVLGVAVIQAVLMGIGFMLAGVPAPGVLALIVLLLAIMQLPALLVALPVILWIWNNPGDSSSVMNTVWTVYILAAGAADNVLKPMLLGRGVDAPMPVILLGALGGMMSSGFVGLFTGAVTLAVGYQIFMRWVANHPGLPDEAAGQGE